MVCWAPMRGYSAVVPCWLFCGFVVTGRFNLRVQIPLLLWNWAFKTMYILAVGTWFRKNYISGPSGVVPEVSHGLASSSKAFARRAPAARGTFQTCSLCRLWRQTGSIGRLALNCELSEYSERVLYHSGPQVAVSPVNDRRARRGTDAKPFEQLEFHESDRRSGSPL